MKQSKLLNPKLWVAFDFIVGGWDIRTAMHHLLEGEPLWAVIMLALGVMLIVLGFKLLSTLEESGEYDVTI